MCIAILKTPEGTITKEQLKNCFDNNPDMGGMAFVNYDETTGKNKLEIWKGYTDFEKFYNDFLEVDKHKDRNILIHFRIATSGGVNELNCHPFYVNDSLVMIHNGVLGSFATPKKDSPYNDTQTFIHEYMVGLPDKIYKNKTFRKLMGEMIGHNKFVLLDNHDNYYIINENLGHWKDGVWYSNYSYASPKKAKVVVDATKDDDDYYYSRYWWGSYWKEKNEERKEEKAELPVEKRYCECCGTELLEGEDLFCEDCWSAYSDMMKDCGKDIRDLFWCEDCQAVVEGNKVYDKGKLLHECSLCGGYGLIPMEDRKELAEVVEV